MAEKGLSSESEIKAALEELPGWKQQGKAITKTFDLKGFKAAMAFAGTVGELADRADHHPDILEGDLDALEPRQRRGHRPRSAAGPADRGGRQGPDGLKGRS